MTGACIVCWQPGEGAHLIDRSLFPDKYGDPRRVVPLCREHHEAYDAHTLDLLPYLEPNHRSELARAVECVGLLATLQRVTGATQARLDELIEADLIQKDIEQRMGL